MKFAICGLIVLLNSSPAAVQAESLPEHSDIPAQRFVPDAATAVKFAVAVLLPIYGEIKSRDEAPFIATLKEGVSSVAGTLQGGGKGGVAEVEISKANGTILRVTPANRPIRLRGAFQSRKRSLDEGPSDPLTASPQ